MWFAFCIDDNHQIPQWRASDAQELVTEAGTGSGTTAERTGSHGRNWAKGHPVAVRYVMDPWFMQDPWVGEVMDLLAEEASGELKYVEVEAFLQG